MEMTDNFIDAIICGKILLHKEEWKISFICNFCEKILPTLPELLRHVLSQHIEDGTTVELEELCEIQTETAQEIDEDSDACDSMLQEILDSQEQDEMDEEILQHFMNKESERNNKSHEKEVPATPTETSDIADNGDSDNDSKIDDDSSNTKIEFLDVPEEHVKPKTTGIVSKRANNTSNTRQCETCNAKFNRIKQLRIHKQIEHGESSFICRQCGVGFSKKSIWMFHEMRHKGIKPYACTMCEKSFTTRSELSLHVRRHTGEHPYKCSYCEKDFASSAALIAHTRTHTKERPYLCPTCGMKFSSPAGLHKHKTTHLSERPYKCSKCSASFKNRGGLHQHLQIHSDVKRYSCSICGKLFAQLAGVHSHMKSTHKTKPNEV